MVSTLNPVIRVQIAVGPLFATNLRRTMSEILFGSFESKKLTNVQTVAALHRCPVGLFRALVLEPVLEAPCPAQFDCLPY